MQCPESPQSSDIDPSSLLSKLGMTCETRTDAEARDTYGKDWLRDYQPAPLCICFPRSVEEVQAVVRLCRDARHPIVPSGGRTGLAGGATAMRGEVVVSLEKMNRISSVNREERTITVEAGATTELVQRAAEEAGLFLPIDFASKGSSQIGGNIATNAGGIRVIRWGMTRAHVAQLSAVLADGSLLRCGHGLVKDQAGYDLKQLFIGSEGTLGIITEATLRLVSPPPPTVRVWAGLERVEDAAAFLTFCREQGIGLALFELVMREALEPVLSFKQKRDPLSGTFPVYVLLEAELAARPDGREVLESILAEAFERGIVQDMVVAESMTQAQELLNLRELISETLSSHYTIHKNDVSVSTTDIPSFLDDLIARARVVEPSFIPAVFGHMGDGNLHVNFIKPEQLQDEEFFSRCHQLDSELFSCVARYRGSVAAEHGVGLLKRDFLPYSRSPEEIAVMRAIKQALDPLNLLNPGKVLPS